MCIRVYVNQLFSFAACCPGLPSTLHARSFIIFDTVFVLFATYVLLSTHPKYFFVHKYLIKIEYLTKITIAPPVDTMWFCVVVQGA